MAKSTFKIPSICELEKSEGDHSKVPSAFANWKSRQQTTSVTKDYESHQKPSSEKLHNQQKTPDAVQDINKDVLPKNGHKMLSEQSNSNETFKSSNSVGAFQDTTNSSSAMTVEQQKGKTSKSMMKHSIVVNSRQKGNPILKSVRNVPYEFGDITPDYEVGAATCVLFLSLRYHNLKPNYIHDRMKQLGRSYNLRILLVLVDIKDPHHCLKELAKICILADYTLILAFSNDEAGRYLETYKAYENKPPDQIMERVDGDYVSQVTDCLTAVKAVNKTNAVTLLSTFGTVAGVFQASDEELGVCPGFGPQKAQRLFKSFHEPFLREKNPESEAPS